jgi:hypothetical protein
MPIARDPQTFALERMASIASRLEVTWPPDATVTVPEPDPNGPEGVGLELSFPVGEDANGVEMVKVQAWFRVSDLATARDEQIVQALRMMVLDSLQGQILHSRCIALSCGTARELVRAHILRRLRLRRGR